MKNLTGSDGNFIISPFQHHIGGLISSLPWLERRAMVRSSFLNAMGTELYWRTNRNSRYINNTQGVVAI